MPALIDRILTAAYGDTGKPLSTKQAAARWRVPAHSVRARVSELRTLGYKVNVVYRRSSAGQYFAVYSIAV